MDDNGQQVDCSFAFTSPLPDSPLKVRHYYASSIVLSNQTQRSCSTSPTSPILLSPSQNSSPSPSPSASPNSFASTLSLNFPSTRTTTSSYSTRHPYPPSVNIAELCRSAVNANGSNSPTAASAAAFLSSDSDGLAVELLWEALDPQLWSSTQLLSSNLASESAAINNTIAMSVAVTHALRQIPSNSIISSTPCSSSSVSFPNCTSSASPSASTISRATTSYSSTPQPPLCILLTSASLSAVLASPLSSMPSSCLAKDANSAQFLHNREFAADFLRDVPDPTPTPKRKWQSTSRTNTRSPVANTQQLQARSIKPVKFNKSLVMTQAAASVIITPSKTDNLAMHLPAPVPFINTGNQTGNPVGGGTWLSIRMKSPVTGELPLA